MLNSTRAAVTLFALEMFWKRAGRQGELMSAGQAQLVGGIACANALGECVVWDARSQRLMWIDIEGRQFFRSEFPFQTAQSFTTPERLGSFGLLPDHRSCVVAAFESGFAIFDYETGDVDWIDRPPLARSVRFNDGRVDRNGRFWAGTMVEDPELRKDAVGQLFRLDPDAGAMPVIEDLKISNSLCWSPDGSIMYFADSPRREIWSYDFADGHPRNRRTFASTAKGAYPDGSTVDADGYLWNAQWGSSKVVRYAPDGTIDFVLETPAPHVSCVAFGGPELDHIIVTTARVELSSQALASSPESGNLFVYASKFRGLPEVACQMARAIRF